MQFLTDHAAQSIQGGHRREKAVNLQSVRQVLKLGAQQINFAINIIIGTGVIVNNQINSLKFGSLL